MQSEKPGKTTARSTGTLLQRFEELMKVSPADLSSMSGQEIQNLVYELQHHLEDLARQNEQLRESRHMNQELESLNSSLEQHISTQDDKIELMAKAVANLDEGVLITNDHQDWPTSRVVFVNRALCDLAGYGPEVLLHQSPGWILGDSIDPTTRQQLQAQLLANQPFRGELVYRHREGTRRDIELSVSPIPDDSNQSTNYVAVIRDITERKRTEQLLRERQERLKSILNTVPDGIITIDLEGIVKDCNPAAAQIFGFAEEELVGQNISLLMPSPHREAHDDYLRRYRETGEAHFLGTSRQLFGQHRNGHQFPIILSVNEIDHLDLYLGIIQDVSELRQLQRELLRATDEVQWRIGQALHDGPQQALAGLSLLSRGLVLDLRQLDSPLEPQAERISTGLKEANGVIRQLARGLVHMHVDSGGLQSALRQLAQHTGEDHGIQCEFICPESVPISDRYTANQLFHIAQEAVLNAVNHSGASCISIRLERNQRQLMLHVVDNGCGFEVQAKGNSGLGMYIMPYRASTVGGEFKVFPAQGGGTEVRCSLTCPD